MDAWVDVLISLNCPYINKVDSKENILQWIQNIDQSKDEKNFLLQWIFNVIGETNVSSSQSLTNLGILKSGESDKFIQGSLSRNKQRSVWTALFHILSAHTKNDLTKEDCLQTKSRLEDFLDNVTESVYLHQQLDKPVPILDYALQKELSKHKYSGGGISRSVLNDILQKVLQEKQNLGCKLDTSASQQDIDISDISNENTVIQKDVENLTNECDRLVKEEGGRFEAKYESDLKPVLNESNVRDGKPAVIRTDDMGRFCDVVNDMSRFLHGSQSFYNQMVDIDSLKSEHISTIFSSLD